MLSGEVIGYRKGVFLNFRDYEFGDEGSHAYRWIDGKVFDLRADSVDDRAILGAVIARVEYHDDYVGGGVDPEGTRHGPYWLDRISPDSYDQVSPRVVHDTVRSWLTPCGKLPRNLEEAIDREVFTPVAGATTSFVLRDLGDSAINDYGAIHSEFHEFIVIDRPAKIVRLVVAADD